MAREQGSDRIRFVHARGRVLIVGLIQSTFRMNRPGFCTVTSRIAMMCALVAVGVTSQSAASTRIAAAPQVRRATKYYELRASTLAELVAEFHGVAGTGDVPVRFGLTKWDILLDAGPNFGTRSSCTSQRVTLRVALTTTLPKAVRSAQFTPDDATEWQRFLLALLRHEAQHDSIVVTHAAAFLHEVESEANRGLQPTSIEQCVTTLVERIERANTTFDALTQHGGTEGATLRVVRGTNGTERRDVWRLRNGPL